MDKNGPRRRNAQATRDDILASARAAFARSGYDGAGLREIAEGAGVTAMMIGRYFGSKENLFAEAVAAAMGETELLGSEILSSPDVAREMAAGLVRITAPDAPILEGFEIALRSAASDTAASLSREHIEVQKLKRLANSLQGDDRETRAAVLIALVAGLQTMRQVIGLTPLAQADPEQLTRLMASVLEPLLVTKSESIPAPPAPS